MSRSRNFCFTLNNYTEDEYKSVFNIGYRYIVVGKEVGESGTPHLQGFISFKSQRSFESVKSMLSRAHIEVARGTVEQNREYCIKGGDFVEQGDRPMSQKEKGQANADRWDDAIIAAKEGRWTDIPGDIRVAHERGLEYIVRKDRMLHRPPEVLPYDGVESCWYWGPPGTGKSLGARRDAEKFGGGLYIKDPKTVWFDRYEGEETVLIDDFDKYQVGMGGEMKRWLDIYPFQAQVKGGSELIRPKRVFVTSNYHPNDIWEDQVTRDAILRRVVVKHVTGGESHPPLDAPCFKRVKLDKI